MTPGIATRGTLDRATIASGFGQGVAYYEDHALAQRFAAGRLVEFFAEFAPPLPEGPILEVGCGTGFLTRVIALHLPDRDLEVTDLAPEMLAFCQERLAVETKGAAIRANFRVADAERVEGDRKYALLAAGFVAQWFDRPAEGLAELVRHLLPGGVLLASLPGEGSFGAWREAAERAGVEFTGLDLPGAEEVIAPLARRGLEIELRRVSYLEEHPSPLHFLHHLRRMGAAPLQGEPLSPAKLRALLRAWPGDPHAFEYEILLILAKAPGIR